MSTEHETETVETPPIETEMVEMSKDELSKLQTALKKANAEAAERRKRLDELEKLETERKEAEMAEIDRLKTQLDQFKGEAEKVKQELAARALSDLRAKIAKDMGLPDSLAPRITGEDEDAMKEDAKHLLEALPKAKTVSATNPGNTATVGETDEQRRARLRPTGDFMFDPEWGLAHGGGVIEKIKKES